MVDRYLANINSLDIDTENDSQVQNGQRLAGVPRGHGVLTVMDSLCFGFGYRFKTARIQQEF